MVMRTFIGRPASSRKAGRGPRRLTFSLPSSYSFLIVPSLLTRRPSCRDDPDRLIPEGVDDQQQSVAFRVGDQDLPDPPPRCAPGRRKPLGGDRRNKLPLPRR